MVRTGAMRHRVSFQELTTELDDAGQPKRTWKAVADRYAALVRLTGKEVVASAARQERVPVVLELRWEDNLGIRAGMRVVFAGKALDIASAVDPDGLGERLLVTATEVSTA